MLHATETGLSSGRMGHLGSCATLPYLPTSKTDSTRVIINMGIDGGGGWGYLEVSVQKRLTVKVEFRLR